MSVGVSTLRVTSKQTSGIAKTPKLRVRVVLYRTVNGGSIFYRLNAPTQEPTYNTPNFDRVTIFDNVPDSQLLSHPPLYTTGGVVENIGTTAPKHLTQAKNRVWLLDSVNPYSLWYSKEVRPGMPVEFSDLFTFNLEPRGGPATAIASLDDKVVVFRDDAVSYILGLGPGPTGEQNDFTEVPIPTDTGCVDPGSIVTGSIGVVYKSKKGFYLLDRSLANAYIGAQVEKYNQYTCTSAVLLPRTNWLLFTLQPPGASSVPSPWSRRKRSVLPATGWPP